MIKTFVLTHELNLELGPILALSCSLIWLMAYLTFTKCNITYKYGLQLMVFQHYYNTFLAAEGSIKKQFEKHYFKSGTNFYHLLHSDRIQYQVAYPELWSYTRTCKIRRWLTQSYKISLPLWNRSFNCRVFYIDPTL